MCFRPVFSRTLEPPSLLIYYYIRITPLRKCKFNNSLAVSGNQGFTSLFLSSPDDNLSPRRNSILFLSPPFTSSWNEGWSGHSLWAQVEGFLQPELSLRRILWAIENDWHTRQYSNTGGRLPRFKCWPSHILVVWLWTSSLISLWLICLICPKETIKAPALLDYWGDQMDQCKQSA